MLSQRFASWTEYFDSRESSTTINKKKIGDLFQAFDHSFSASETANKLEKSNQTVFLAKLSLNGGLQLFHHFLQVGDPLYSDDSTHSGFIVGTQKDTASGMTPDVTVLLNDPDLNAVSVPKREEIMNCDNIADIDNLVSSTTQSIRPRNFIPVPPFLVNIIENTIQISGGDAKVILKEVITSIKTFDDIHVSDAEYVDKAAIKCKFLVQWLYLASIGETHIKKIPVQICGCSALASKFNKLKQEIFGQNDVSSHLHAFSAPLSQLATSTRTTQEAIGKLVDMQSQNSEKSSNSFKKIPSTYKKMLMIANGSSNIVPDTLNDEAMAFFALSKAKLAHIHLNSMLETENIRVSVSPALANHLWNGSFLWVNHVTPSGLAASVLTSESYLKNDVLQEALVLDISTRFSISDENVSKLTETTIVFPVTVDEFLERQKALHLLSVFFFEEDKLLPQALKMFLNWCNANRALLEARTSGDKKYLVKLTLAIDERIYLWLRSCCRAANLNDTKQDLMNFHSMVSNIEINCFNYSIPSAVKSLKNDKDSGSSSNKKQKTAGKRVENNNMVDSWKLRPNESYDNVFKDKVKNGPILSMGCHGCHKFHNKGYCFDDCHNKDSHKELSGDDWNKFDRYCKVCRGE